MKRFGKLMLLVLALGLPAVIFVPHTRASNGSLGDHAPRAPIRKHDGRSNMLGPGQQRRGVLLSTAIPVPNGLAMQIDYVSITVSLSPVGSNLLGASLGYLPTACVEQTMPGLGVIGPCQASVSVQPPCSLIGTNPSPTPPILPFSNYVCSGPVTLYASQGNQSPFAFVSSTATSGEVFVTISGHYIKNPGD